MNKIILKIYFIIFTILILGLFVSIFALIFKKDIKPIKTPEVISNSATEITWTEAVYLIQECQVKTVFQQHDLEVTITTKDSRIFKTKEPKIDEVFKEVNHLRSDCNDIIQQITE